MDTQVQIKDYFTKPTAQEIYDVINNIQPESCIDNFCNYMMDDLTKEASEFERAFKSYLSKHLTDFLTDITKKAINKMSKEELIDQISIAYIEGTTNIEQVSDYCDADSYAGYIEQFYTDTDFYPIVKQFLNNSFNEVNKNMDLNKYDSQIRSLKEKIEISKNTIERNQKTLEELQIKLDKVKKYKELTETI